MPFAESTEKCEYCDDAYGLKKFKNIDGALLPRWVPDELGERPGCTVTRLPYQNRCSMQFASQKSTPALREKIARLTRNKGTTILF